MQLLTNPLNSVMHLEYIAEVIFHYHLVHWVALMFLEDIFHYL